jgi:hypothetical protein
VDLGALQAVWLMLGEAERDHTRHHGFGREMHDIAHLVLARHDHRGEDPAEAESTRCEEDAPAERVDRCAPYKGVAVEVAIDCSKRAQICDNEQEGRHLVEMLCETTLAGRGRKLCRMRTRIGLGLHICDRGPRHEAGGAHRQILVPPLEVEIAESPSDRLIAQDHYSPSLTVAAARGKARSFEHRREQIVGHGIWKELTSGARRPESIDKVHTSTVPAR